YMIHLRKVGLDILNEADKIIFLSESYLNLMIENYIPNNKRNEILNKSEIIPNGIDEFWLNNKGIPKKASIDELKILYVGAINKNKNILTTIRAIEVLKNKGINATYTIVGNVEDESVYQQ